MRSVERWRRAWRESGEAAVLSKGSPGRPRLSEAQLARLERVGTWSAGHGWSWQQPALRAIERDDDAIEVWRKEIWPRVRAPRRSGGAWIVFEDAAGQSMTPPRARTWDWIGRTPVVRVRGRGSGRVSMAGMACYKPGERSRLIYAIREYRGRKGEPKSFDRRDFRDLIVRARIRLGGPIVLVRDNVRLHLTIRMRDFIDVNAEWLTLLQLPTYAPDLNPQEGVRSLVRRDNRQPRRGRPQPDHHGREAPTQEDPVPAARGRRLPRRRGPGLRHRGTGERRSSAARWSPGSARHW